MLVPDRMPAAAFAAELNSPGFEVEFEYFWERLATGMESIVSAETLSELKEQAICKEFAFYRKIHRAVTSMVEQTNGPITCLFDIDGTLGEIKDEDSEAAHTLLRPVAKPLISELAVTVPERLRFGILSFRRQESLDAEIENPTFLSPVAPFMDKNLVMSSTAAVRNDPLINGVSNADQADFLRTLYGIMDQRLLDRTLQGEIDPFEWYDPKIGIVAGYLAENPTVSLVLVDDRPYVAFFDASNKRLRGVHVEEQSQILIPPDIFNLG